MSDKDIKTALHWYCSGFPLSTIAQHFGITIDELARELNNQ